MKRAQEVADYLDLPPIPGPDAMQAAAAMDHQHLGGKKRSQSEGTRYIFMWWPAPTGWERSIRQSHMEFDCESIWISITIYFNKLLTKISALLSSVFKLKNNETQKMAFGISTILTDKYQTYQNVKADDCSQMVIKESMKRCKRKVVQED